MRKLLGIFLSFLILFSFFYCTKGANASSFGSGYVRLDRQVANTLLSGTTCAQASSAGAGIENSISVAFPSSFIISLNASNWTTTTTNLPSGSSSWPSIGPTAISVSGQNVTFSSGDLISSALYCFNFSSPLSQTGPTGDNNFGTITTKDNLNTTIDSSSYNLLSIISNDQIAITATIDPHISDLPISIASLTPGTQFSENSTIQYQITYGLSTTPSFPLTIQASWSQGTVQGSPTPSVDILDYVVGSATSAYGGTTPVIDTVNRTITWTINSIPGGTTNQTVNFSLKTNSSYTGTSLVSFDVSAHSASGSTITPDTSLTQNYLYQASLVPTVTPITATPTSVPSTSTTTTPTPTNLPTKIPLAFSDISINSISFSSATISVSTTKNTTLTLYYGTSITSLSKSVKTIIPKTQDLITLNDLTPDTNYFFKIIATDSSGNTVKSDIFTLKTAKISTAPSVNLNSLIATSNKNILLNPTVTVEKPNGLNYIVVPKSTVFEIQFALDKYALVKTIQAFVKNKNVLGFNTIDENQAYSNFADLVEIQPGIYTGKLKSQPEKGIYELMIRIVDFYGNIKEQKIAEVIVTDKFLIVDKKGDPIENARILLSLYNEKSKVYDVISPEVLQIENPSYSNPDGTVDIVLPIGKYKASVSGIGYNDKTLEFEVGPYALNYPKIALDSQSFSIANFIRYYSNTFTDAVTASQRFVRVYSISNRFFNFMTSFTLLMFVIIALVSFSFKTHIPLLAIPYFFIFKIKVLMSKNKKDVVFGKIIDEENKNPVSKANVYIIDTTKNKILAHLTTNKLGEFYIGKLNTENFKINVVKKDYLPSENLEYALDKLNNMPIEIKIQKTDIDKTNIVLLFEHYLEDFFGLSLEYLLIITVIFEVYFTFTFGIARTFPYLTITIFNILALILFIYKPRNLSS